MAHDVFRAAAPAVRGATGPRAVSRWDFDERSNAGDTPRGWSVFDLPSNPWVSLTSGDLAGLVIVEKHRVDDMLSCPRVGNLALARRCQVCVVSVVSLVALTSDDASCLILKRTYKYNTVCSQIHFLNNE
jgi:hypothetical protein